MMIPQSSISIVILIIAIVLYMTEYLPLCVTAMLSAIAAVIFGILSWSDLFSVMGSSTIMLVIFMSVMGDALLQTGFISLVCEKILVIGSHLSKKTFIVLVYLLACVSTAAFPSNAVTCMYLPLLDELSLRSGGKLERKHTYMPLAVGSLFGSTLTIAGAGSVLAGVTLLANSSFAYQMSFFEPAKIGIACSLAGLIGYATIQYSLQEKCFTFEENRSKIELELYNNIASEKEQSRNVAPWKKWFTLALMLAGVYFMATGSNIGGVSITIAVICMAFKCIDPRKSFENVNWSTVFMLFGSTAFASSLAKSGAGQLISDSIVNLCGPLANNAFVMAVIICTLAMLLSQFMSNAAAVAIVVPIGLALADSLSASGIGFAMAGTIGANIAISTPVCAAPMGIVLNVGYRFKDYVKVNSGLNLLALIATCVALKIFYF